jgi:hypothetical protein
MPVVARSARASVDTSQAEHAPSIVGLIAGATLPALCPCRINADGTVGIAAGTDNIAGVTPRDALAGEPITLYGVGTRARFGDGMTPGTLLYVGTGGDLYTSTAVGEGTGAAVALVVTPQDIMVIRSV